MNGTRTALLGGAIALFGVVCYAVGIYVADSAWREGRYPVAREPAGPVEFWYYE